jgi:hypothetical protein
MFVMNIVEFKEAIDYMGYWISSDDICNMIYYCAEYEPLDRGLFWNSGMRVLYF